MGHFQPSGGKSHVRPLLIFPQEQPSGRPIRLGEVDMSRIRPALWLRQVGAGGEEKPGVLGEGTQVQHLSRSHFASSMSGNPDGPAHQEASRILPCWHLPCSAAPARSSRVVSHGFTHTIRSQQACFQQASHREREQSRPTGSAAEPRPLGWPHQAWTSQIRGSTCRH